MKRYFKILFFFFIFLFSYNYILADETNESVPTTNSVTVQKDAISKYCTNGEKIGGCLYDKNDELYTTIKSGKKTFIIPPMTDGHPYTGTLNVSNDLKVLRGYQTFDGNGNAIYAACYRYDYNSYKESEHTGLGNGSYFFFEFVTENKKGTCVRSQFVVPSEGTRSYTYIRNLNPFGGNFWGFDVDTTYEYDGKENIDGFEAITFNNWKATDGGDCPKVFGYTANTKWYTMTSNKYIFSENADDFNIDTFAFWSGEKYLARPGCTVDDEAGEQVNTELLLSEIKTEINKFTCPDNIADMYKLSNELTGYYETLRNDKNNPYRVLWSHDLAEEVIQKSESEINKYIKEKLTSCQYKICNITSTEQTKIKQNMGETCKLGCSINNYNKPSQEANAQCYCCGGSQGCTYKWTTPTNGSQCTLQEHTPLGLCIGTTKDAECRSCLITAYEKAGLNEEKSKCLIDSEILKNVTESDLKESNDTAADDALQTEMEENEQLRENIFNSLLKVPNLNYYTGPMNCAKLMGDNLVLVMKFIINAVRVASVIATIVICMMTMLPAVTNGDASELNKAIKKCILVVIIMLLIVLTPVLLKTIANIFGFDFSCFI